MSDRRSFFGRGLALVTGFIATAALAACGKSSPVVAPIVNPVSGDTVSVSVFAADVQYVNNGIKSILAVPQVLALIPANAQTQIITYEAQITSTLALVASSDATISISTAQNWVTTITTDVNSILSLVSQVSSIPSNVTTLIEAIESLIPVIELAVALKVNASNARSLTPNEARKILAVA